VEVDSGVLIAERNRGSGRFGRLRVVDCVEIGMAAGGGFTRGIVAHAFCVGAPGLADRVELVRQRFDGSRVDAAVADGLPSGVVPVRTKSAKTRQSLRVSGVAACPLIMAMKLSRLTWPVPKY